MLRRSPALPAALTAALFLAAWPAPAHAAGIIPNTTAGSATFQLSNTNPSGTAPVTKIVANVTPPGIIVPPDPSTSPLTILSGSSGFDQSNVKVSLGSGSSPTGEPLQALALDFGTNGFQPGGVLDFSVSLDKAFQGTPSLVLPADATGLTVTQLANQQPPPTNSGGGAVPPTTPTPPGDQVPEPLTLLLWSTGAVGVSMARARSRRRTRQAQG